MLVLLNTSAGGGTAPERWKRLEPAFRVMAREERAGVGDACPLRVARPATPEATDRLVTESLACGERTFVAAGGDGTVNRVVNALVRAVPSGQLEEVRLGAVGLGSSNDFHKPISRRRWIDGVPVRIAVRRSRPHDVGCLRYRDTEGRPGRRRWIVNGSVGVTADANAFFNGDASAFFNGSGSVLRLLKERAPGLAIGYAALRTLLRCRPRPFLISVDAGDEEWLELTNLAVVKNPHFAGDFRYDSPYEPASGSFHLHVLGALSRARLLAALAGLSRGRFAGMPGAVSRVAGRVVVRSPEAFSVETDGEVLVVREAEFSLHPARLLLCE